MKFYPQDFNGDERLRLCSLAARGLWACFFYPMHKSEPRGHLLVSGRKPTYLELAQLVGCKEREVKYGIEELVKNGVCDVTAEGVLVSRRMVRETAQRQIRQENGRLGGHPLLKREVNHQTPNGLTNHITPIASSFLSSGISSGSSEKEEPLDVLLDRFLRDHYPPEGYQAGWDVEQAWTAALEGEDRAAQFHVLCDAVAQHKRSEQWVAGKIPMVSRWLKEKRWRQRLREPEVPKVEADVMVAKAMERIARNEALYGKKAR